MLILEFIPPRKEIVEVYHYIQATVSFTAWPSIYMLSVNVNTADAGPAYES